MVMTHCNGSPSFLSSPQRRHLCAALFVILSAVNLCSPLEAGDAPNISIHRTNARKIASRIGRSIVNIQIIHKEEGKRYFLASFSGIILKGPDHFIVSCCSDTMHLLESEKNHLEVTYHDLWTTHGTLYAKDPETGLCLIRCKGRKNPPEGISLSTPAGKERFLKKGLRILTISNPYGIENSVRYGVVSGMMQQTSQSLPFSYELYLPGMPGEGGGCVSDFQGNIAGIINPVPFVTTAYGRRFFAKANHWPKVEVLPLPVVDHVVKALKTHKRVLRGYVGAKFCVEEKNSNLAVRVTALRPDGPAAKAGLEEDDLICKIRGNSITALKDLYQTAIWVEYEGLGQSLPITVKRGETAQEKPISIRIGLSPDTHAEVAADN